VSMGAPHDAPSATELLEAVREWIDREVIASTDGRLRFHARVASNVLAMVEREIELGPAQAAAHEERLKRLGVADDAELALRFAIAASTTERSNSVRSSPRWSPTRWRSPTRATSTADGTTADGSRTGSAWPAEGDRLAGSQLAARGVDVGAAIAADPWRWHPVTRADLGTRSTCSQRRPRRRATRESGSTGIRLMCAVRRRRRQSAGQLDGHRCRDR
jgi:hypothetical protein